MAHRLAHQERVAAWIARLVGAPATQLVDALDGVVGALWRRAQQPLGDTTVRAIVSRVVLSSASRHPVLATLHARTEGVSCEALRAAAAGGAVDAAELRAAADDLLVELLTVLGALTGNVLTPALHGELRGDDAAPVGVGEASETRVAGQRGETT
jgi:hypothetical protein